MAAPVEWNRLFGVCLAQLNDAIEFRQETPHSGRRPLGEIAEEVFDAFVIKYHGNAAWANEDRHSFAVDQRLGMVDLKLLAAEQYNSERLKGRPFLEGLEGFFKAGGGHLSILRGAI
ncbi:MAG: hypothetical protein K2X38_14345 [Gemmataceae bacterium]|nr:hypothetical protein [Gemmataceae bacterium]